jgi:divalent metal cation (Fe/Co/Zn/Cd) transporter
MARRRARSGTTVVIAMLAAAATATAKLVAFLATSSAAVLASSVQSFIEAGNEALLLLGRRRASRPATLQNPFGYGRERSFWSLAVTVMVLCVGGTLAIVEGLRRAETDAAFELASPTLVIAVLAGAAAFEVLALAVAIHRSKVIKGNDTTWRRFLRRSNVPELPVVLLQKTGGLVGLVLTGAAVATAHLTDDAAWDSYGMVAIGGLMALLALVLTIETHSLLIARTAGVTDQQRIAAAIEIEPSVRRLLHMRTEHLGPEEMLVGAKFELIGGMTVDEVTEAVGRIEATVRRAVPAARVLYLEPDICRTGAITEALAPAVAHDPWTRSQASASPDHPNGRHDTPPDPPATDMAEFVDLADLSEPPQPTSAAERTLDESGWGRARPLDPAPLPVPEPRPPGES